MNVHPQAVLVLKVLSFHQHPQPRTLMVVESIKAELGQFRGGSQVDHHRPMALNRQFEAVV
jgi:hypothetical protein